MTTIYLSGALNSRSELLGYAKQLRLAGHVVTSSWLESSETEADEAALRPEQLAAVAEMNLRDIVAARIFVGWTTPASRRSGHHVEFGCALWHTRLIVLIGPPQNVFHWHAAVERVETWAEALRVIAEVR